ncbi:MAG TPA: TrbI/VirB10 family protein, partial [Vicinamibacterales bacterium]|nr:TrbI/VirB10 family protein [Vicinamibacterales bacterium]
RAASTSPVPPPSRPASNGLPQAAPQAESVAAAAAPANPPPATTRPAQEPSSPAPATVSANVPEPPQPLHEQLVVPSSSVIGLRVETPLSSERTQVEDRVDARVTRDVLVDGRVAVPAGTRAVGSVVVVERGGKMRDRARLGVRFHTLMFDDGTELPLNTEAIYREGDSPSNESTRKIGGAAIGGAILGAIIGGKKGAMVGSATGAAGGAAVVMAGDRNAATFPAGSIVTIRLAAPVEVEVEKR